VVTLNDDELIDLSNPKDAKEFRTAAVAMLVIILVLLLLEAARQFLV